MALSSPEVTAALRKAALTAHIVSSVGWLGAVAVFLALAITGLAGGDSELGRSSYVVMEPIAWFVIVPLAFAAFVTGLVQSLVSSWGLARHYWVLVKLAITVIATVVLLLQLESISHLAEVAAETQLAGEALRAQRLSLLVHTGGGLLVLLVPTILAVYKPRGRTRYGRRNELRDAARADSGPFG